jgi:hypothetical protein
LFGKREERKHDKERDKIEQGERDRDKHNMLALHALGIVGGFACYTSIMLAWYD